MLTARKRAGWMLLGALAITLAGPARADIDARRVLSLLRTIRPPRPLLDDGGKLPLLVRLPAGARAADRGLMEVAPGLGTIHLSAEEARAYAASYPDLSLEIGPPRRTFIADANAHTHAFAFRNDTGLSGAGVVVGIIDTGLDTRHRDFRNADGSTRVAWLMTREKPRGVHAQLEAAYGCTDPNQSPCAIYSAADIDALLAQNPDAAPRDPDGHGTHVTSLAAGNGDLSLSTPVFVGVAPEATLIIVAPSGGGGFSDPDIINGARFVFERAEALGMPAVVNVSLGSDFGPHDGTSALEAGLAALVGDDKPGRALVVAVGNSGTLYELEDGVGPLGVHTEAHVSPNAVTRVPILQPGAKGEVEGAGFVWITFRPGDDVNVGLEGPDGISIGLTGPGDEKGHNSSAIAAGIVNNLVNHKTSLNPDTNSAVVFWDGSWSAGEFEILLSGRGDAQLWVSGIGGAAPGQTLGLNFARGLKSGTVAVPASHPELLAVGCTINKKSWSWVNSEGAVELDSFGGKSPVVVDSPCYFSGAGPTATGVMKPDLLAPGAFVTGAMSRDADPRTNPASMFVWPSCGVTPAGDRLEPCLVVDETHALTSGTSMSSPQVAGAAALLLQADPSLTQREITELLQAGAHHARGDVPYDYQHGPGELDLPGTLQVLANKLDGAPVDVTTSYYVLASPYLRPDPSWPVEATVQLRHADGSIVTGATIDDLSVEIDGGLLVRPLERVRAGQFRFAAAAPRGSGGTEARLEVRYRGASLGARALPVGVDWFAAGSGVDAVGGCAQGGGGSTGAGWLLGMIAALWGTRRRLEFFGHRGRG